MSAVEWIISFLIICIAVFFSFCVGIYVGTRYEHENIEKTLKPTWNKMVSVLNNNTIVLRQILEEITDVQGDVETGSNESSDGREENHDGVQPGE